MSDLHSETEYHLRTLVDRLTTALVQESPVYVIPSDEWEAHPLDEPPRLFYRVADVAVLGDQIVAVTAREIARLLFTREGKWPYKVAPYESEAELLLNVIETARVEAKMSQLYRGCRSIFDEYNGDKPPYGAWSNPQVVKDFDKLPVKWRFVLNIQRRLNGLALIGSGFERPWVEDIESSFTAAAMEDTTQEAIDDLEPVFQKLIDAITRESEWKEEEEKYQEYCHKCSLDKAPPSSKKDWKDEGKPEGPPDTENVKDIEVREALPDDFERNENVSDYVHKAAEQDDGKPGGEDGSPGKRQDGRSSSEEESPNASNGGSDGESTSSNESNTDGNDGSDDDSAGAHADSGRNSSDGDGRVLGDLEEGDSEEAAPAKVKTGNIFRELSEDLGQGEGGKAVKNFRDYFNKIDRQAHKVEKEIAAEREDQMQRIAEGLGSSKKTERVRRAANEGANEYPRIRETVDPLIRHLRSYTEQVLKDNERDRWGGSYKSGRRMKRKSLYRIVTQEEPLVFEKKVVLGGKSYCIGFCVDQSGSMTYNNKSLLAGVSTIIALEAFDGLIETAATGFFSASGHWGESQQVNFYKRIDEPILVTRPLLPQLFTTRGSTPMGAGLWGVLEQVKKSESKNKSIILISDGVPTDGYDTIDALRDCYAERIQMHALAIDGIKQFHTQNFKRVIEVTSTEDIVPAFFNLLRGIIRREAAVA